MKEHIKRVDRILKYKGSEMGLIYIRLLYDA